MKLHVTLLALLLTGSISSLVANESAEALFDAKCALCHSKTKPTDMSSVVAPAIMGVMRHVKMSYPTKDKAVAFMVDYVLEPSKDKAICMSQKIERFGLMPSQKGVLSKEELTLISNWLYDNYPPDGFRGMGQGGMRGHGKMKGQGL
jgi:cytochrome c